jgi:hypothetical protein
VGIFDRVKGLCREQVDSCKKCRTNKSGDNHVIYQIEKLKGHFRSVPRALYIHKEWLMIHRVLVSSIVIKNAIWNQI